MRGRGPGLGRRTICRPSSRWGATTTTSTCTGRPRRSPTTWEPEAIIDLETWRRLRAELENRWLSGQPPSGAAECGTQDPAAYVACEGPYLVHLADPGINPPNLAAVQELSAGIYRVGAPVTVPDSSSCGWTTSG